MVHLNVFVQVTRIPDFKLLWVIGKEKVKPAKKVHHHVSTLKTYIFHVILLNLRLMQLNAINMIVMNNSHREVVCVVADLLLLGIKRYYVPNDQKPIQKSIIIKIGLSNAS